MKFSGSLTAKDIRNAYWRHIAPRMGIGIVGVVIVFAATALFVYAFVVRADRAEQWRANRMFPAAWIYILLVLTAYPAWRAKRLAKESVLYREEKEYRADEAGLSVESSHGVVRIGWSEFKRVKENRDGLNFYITGAQYIVVPRRLLMSSAEADEFRSWIGRIASDRPGLANPSGGEVKAADPR